MIYENIMKKKLIFDFGKCRAIMNNQSVYQVFNEGKKPTNNQIACAIRFPTLNIDYTGSYFWGLLPRDIEDIILKYKYLMEYKQVYDEWCDRLTIPRLGQHPLSFRFSTLTDKKVMRLEAHKALCLEYDIKQNIEITTRRPRNYSYYHGVYKAGNRGTLYTKCFITSRSVWGHTRNKHGINGNYFRSKSNGIDLYKGREEDFTYRFKARRQYGYFFSDSKMLMEINMNTPISELKRIWKDDYKFKGHPKINTKNRHLYINALYKYGGNIIHRRQG
jgi:hypothetical protein